MQLHGKNIIGQETSAGDAGTFLAENPDTGRSIPPAIHQATDTEVNRAMELAASAAQELADNRDALPAFLERVADEMMELGDELIDRANAETALPAARLTGERGRTVNQVRLFAELVREGSWVEASIDTAIPDRQPIPKPDLRRLLRPIGPVVVFGASNFPLAFSVAGGDTASAWAAGNPVVVKAHPSHPGTSELVARAIGQAVIATKMPAGIFSMLHSASPRVGQALVRHPITRAVGFTGSLAGGRALFDTAAVRPDPIPVYAEMGSVNPVFVLPGALGERAEAIAQGLVGSVTLGVGQFCTNPGLVFGLREEGLERLIAATADQIDGCAPGTMLNRGIRQAYQEAIDRLREIPGVELVRQSAAAPNPAKTQVAAAVLATDARAFRANRRLQEEVFGPVTVVVRCQDRGEMEQLARGLPGQLTSTVHGTPDDLEQFRSLIAILETKVGRLIVNGYPTGLEVCPSMQHGGPYPATTDVRSTSVGTAAIKRFARPICYQDFPEGSLPVELQNTNHRKIWRLINGQWTNEDIPVR